MENKITIFNRGKRGGIALIVLATLLLFFFGSLIIFVKLDDFGKQVLPWTIILLCGGLYSFGIIEIMVFANNGLHIVGEQNDFQYIRNNKITTIENDTIDHISLYKSLGIKSISSNHLSIGYKAHITFVLKDGSEVNIKEEIDNNIFQAIQENTSIPITLKDK